MTMTMTMTLTMTMTMTMTMTNEQEWKVSFVALTGDLVMLYVSSFAAGV